MGSIAGGLIDDRVTGHDGEAARDGANENVRDGCVGLHRSDANFAKQLAAALNQEFGIGDNTLAVPEAEDDEIPSLIDSKDGSLQPGAHHDFLAIFLLGLKLGDGCLE